jgi:transposase
MLDRHAVQALLQAGRSPRQIADQLGVSRRTVQRIALEPPGRHGRRCRGAGRARDRPAGTAPGRARAGAGMAGR